MQQAGPCRAKAAGPPGHRSPAGSIQHTGEKTAQLLPQNGLGEPRGWKSRGGRDCSLAVKGRLLGPWWNTKQGTGLCPPV